MNRPAKHLILPTMVLLMLAACSPAASEETADHTSPTATEHTTTSSTVTPTTLAPPTTSTAAPTSLVSEAGHEVRADRNVRFTDGLSLDVFSPTGPGPWPTIVFFHGGSWYGGAKENVEPFAEAVAQAGAVVFNATYRTGQLGGGYPQSYQDIACAIALANATTASYGGDQDRVIVAGYSAGAQLAATVLLSGDTFSGGGCAEEAPIEADGFVGLAGPYDVTSFALLLTPWFGGTITEIPEVFSAGSPYGYLDALPIPVLLIHGTADELVPTSFSTGFAEALNELDWEVETALLEGVTHAGIIDPLLDGVLSIDMLMGFALSDS